MPYVERMMALRNGPPWGFRLVENPSTGLLISRIRKSSPAEEAGLHEGDRVIAINGITVEGLTHARAVQIIDFAAFVLNITVGRHESKVVENFFFEAQKPTEAEIESSMLLNLDYAQPEPEPEPEPVEEEPMVIPASPDVQPVPISKLLQPSEDLPPLSPKGKKKNFADSAFYHDTEHYFPTIEEQKEMAKKVANSLTDQLNFSSKGAAMFGKRKKRASKWTTGASDSEEEEFFEMDNMQAENDFNSGVKETAVPVMYGIDLETTIPDDAPPPIPPPPPLPPPPGFPGLVPERKANVPPPPPLPPGAPKTQAEFLERIKAYPRTKHNTVAPETCFDIASALHNSNSRGAQIFAKRRQRAKKWETESGGDGENKASQEPQPKLAMTLGPNMGGGIPVLPEPVKAKVPSKLTPKIAQAPVAVAASSYSGGDAGPASATWRPVAFNMNKTSDTSQLPVAMATAPGASGPSTVATSGTNSGPGAGWKSVPFNIPQKTNAQ